MMKERILDYIYADVKNKEVVLEGRWFVGLKRLSGGGFFRTGVAAFVLFIFVSTVVLFSSKPPLVNAKSTYIYGMDGDVVIIRKANILKARLMMELAEGDKVVTEDGSSVVIHFFDDSTTRLSENTELKMDRLDIDPLNPVKTHVSLYMDSGHMWTHVVNLTNDSSFFIDTPSLTADVKKKAAFDLIAANNDIVVEKISQYKNVDEQSEWVVDNLSDDEKYYDSIVADAEKFIEEGGSNLLSFDDGAKDEKISKAKEDIDDAYRVLVNAEAQLVRGARREAGDGLREFKRQVAVLVGSLPALEQEDPVRAQIIRDMLQEKISVQLKDFASFKPGDRLYRAKEVLQDADLAIASTDVERVKVQLNQAEDALLEMQKLLLDGKPHLASTLLKRYQQKTDDFSTIVQNDFSAESDEFANLVREQVEHMKVLTSIEQSIVYRDQFEFRDKVRNVREETLREFISALEKNPDNIPPDVLLEVKDLYDSYVEDDNDLINPAVEVLLNKEYQVVFLNPSDNKNELDDVVVIEIENASSDVHEGGEWLLSSN